MTIKEGTLTNKSATLVLTNNNDKNFQYGNPYEIEIKKDGKWHKINVELNFDMPAFQLLSKESKEIELDWENEYGKLAKGTYRIIKEIDYECEEGKYETFNVAIKFEKKVLTVNQLYTLKCIWKGEKMTIKEVEKKLNITRANIRFYEKEGLLEPKRCDNEYRDYSEDDLKRLEKILLFRKCNISIENIRLIFNGVKNLDEIFKEQISVIENEVKQLNGAKIMCKKLSQEKSSVDTLDTDKYINIMNSEEQKGNRFYDIADDYIFATEKLYQSIIENKKFKGGYKMKK